MVPKKTWFSSNLFLNLNALKGKRDLRHCALNKNKKQPESRQRGNSMVGDQSLLQSMSIIAKTKVHMVRKERSEHWVFANASCKIVPA